VARLQVVEAVAAGAVGGTVAGFLGAEIGQRDLSAG